MFNRNAGIILLIALAAGLGLLAAQQLFAPKPPANAPATEAITLYPQPRELPDFNLAQSDGTRLIPGELKGHWTLVFLGFTFCPDVCPTTLAELAGAQNQWEALPDSLRPRVLFISVDPDRDSATRLGEYVHGSTRTPWPPPLTFPRWSASPPRWASCSRRYRASISTRTPRITPSSIRPAWPCSTRRAALPAWYAPRSTRRPLPATCRS